MKTRSQTNVVIIDFDAASEAWKMNKISQGNGTYRYCCMTKRKNGRCVRKIVGPNEYCKQCMSNIQK